MSMTDSINHMARTFSSIQKLENPAKITTDAVHDYIEISHNLIQTIDSISTFFDDCYHNSETLSENISKNFSLHIRKKSGLLSRHLASLAETIQAFCSIQNANKEAPPLASALVDEDSIPSLLLACSNLNHSLGQFLCLYEKSNQKIFTRFAFINHFNALHHIFALWNNRLNYIIRTDRTHPSPDMDLLHTIASIKNELYQFHLKLSALESEYNRIEQIDTIRRNKQILTENLSIPLLSKTKEPLALITSKGATDETILCVYKNKQWSVARANALNIPIETPIVLSHDQTIESPKELEGLPAPEPLVLYFNQLLARVSSIEATPQTTRKGNIIFKKGSLVYENRNLLHHILDLYQSVVSSNSRKSKMG